MNRVICRRFTRGLFSCFLLLVLFGFGPSRTGTMVPALAAGDPVPIKDESSKEEIKLKVSSDFSKERIDRARSVTSKQGIDQTLNESKRTSPDVQLRFDTEKS